MLSFSWLAGWGARIRTWEWRNQNPLPYHLPTRQSARHRNPVPISCQAERATPLEGPLITLVSPDQAELAIVLRGDLAAILRFAAGKEKPRHPFGGRVLDALLSQKSVVAGARNTRFLRLVERTIPRLGVRTSQFKSLPVDWTMANGHPEVTTCPRETDTACSSLKFTRSSGA